MRASVPDQQSTVQKLLDENSRLIDIIREYQNQSRADEAIKHQQLLHRNLIHLSNLADPFLLNQLRDDASPQADPNFPMGTSNMQPVSQNPPQHSQQPHHPLNPQGHHLQNPAIGHHHPSMMPPAAPSPSGPGGPMQPPAHGFAPPPMNAPQEMMNHQSYQAQMRAQQQQHGGPPPPQGYPPFGQPAPQMGGPRMPYYPPQGMPGYPGGPPPHGYEGYPPPGSQPPPQGYMR